MWDWGTGGGGVGGGYDAATYSKLTHPPLQLPPLPYVTSEKTSLSGSWIKNQQGVNLTRRREVVFSFFFSRRQFISGGGSSASRPGETEKSPREVSCELRAHGGLHLRNTKDTEESHH